MHPRPAKGPEERDALSLGKLPPAAFEDKEPLHNPPPRVLVHMHGEPLLNFGRNELGEPKGWIPDPSRGAEGLHQKLRRAAFLGRRADQSFWWRPSAPRLGSGIQP